MKLLTLAFLTGLILAGHAGPVSAYARPDLLPPVSAPEPTNGAVTLCSALGLCR